MKVYTWYNTDMEIPIIFEDSEIVVIDKPSGVVCNRAETIKEETLQDWWDQKYKSSNLKFSNSQINTICGG